MVEIFILKLIAAGALACLAIRFLLMEAEAIVAGFRRIRRATVRNGVAAARGQKRKDATGGSNV